MSKGLAELPGDVGLRAALLNTGRFELSRVSALLDELGIDPLQSLVSLDAETRRRLAQRLDALNPDDAAASASPWRPQLERTRAMVYRYALSERVLEWDPERPRDGLARWLTSFLAGEGPDVEARKQLERLDAKLGERVELSADGPCALYQEIVYLFGLEPVEEDLLWLYLAPAFEPHFQWLYDALSRTASLGALAQRLAAQIVSAVATSAGELRAREQAVAAALHPSAKLRRFALIEPAGSAELFRAAPRLVQALSVARLSDVPESLAGLARYAPAGDVGKVDELLPAIDRELAVRLRKLLRQRRNRFLILGPRGAGAQTLARVIAGVHSLSVATLDLDAMLSHGTETDWRFVLREAVLQRAMLLLKGVDAVGRSELSVLNRERLLGQLATFPSPMVFDVGPSLATEHVFHLAQRLDAVSLRIGLPDREQRRVLWTWALGAEASDAGAPGARQAIPAPVVGELVAAVDTFPLGADQIVEAVDLGRVFTVQSQHDHPHLELAALKRACQSLLGHRLGQVASRVETKHHWNDLILPESVREQIEELIAYGRLSKMVLEDWGFGASLSYGKGLTALFSGASGTGKTMVAGLIARELGMDLYRVDLSRMVSKYIGETEKQLAMLFDEARSSGCALLFDEADSLFGKRTEVQSSTDRYANLEVNFLLQQVEEHPGMVLLTSNFPKSIDEAFMRRLRFRIEFPRPEADERRHMWERMIAKQAPQDDDLKLQSLAEVFELSGGEIRNAVMRAALYAASENRAISAADLERSARAEYRQLGRLVPINRRNRD